MNKDEYCKRAETTLSVPLLYHQPTFDDNNKFRHLRQNDSLNRTLLQIFNCVLLLLITFKIIVRRICKTIMSACRMTVHSVTGITPNMHGHVRTWGFDSIEIEIEIQSLTCQITPSERYREQQLHSLWKKIFKQKFDSTYRCWENSSAVTKTKLGKDSRENAHQRRRTYIKSILNSLLFGQEWQTI